MSTLREILGEEEYQRLLAEGKGCTLYEIPASQMSREELMVLMAFVHEMDTGRMFRQTPKEKAQEFINKQ